MFKQEHRDGQYIITHDFFIIKIYNISPTRFSAQNKSCKQAFFIGSEAAARYHAVIKHRRQRDFFLVFIQCRPRIVSCTPAVTRLSYKRITNGFTRHIYAVFVKFFEYFIFVFKPLVSGRGNVRGKVISAHFGGCHINVVCVFNSEIINNPLYPFLHCTRFNILFHGKNVAESSRPNPASVLFSVRIKCNKTFIRNTIQICVLKIIMQ